MYWAGWTCVGRRRWEARGVVRASDCGRFEDPEAAIFVNLRGMESGCVDGHDPLLAGQLKPRDFVVGIASYLAEVSAYLDCHFALAAFGRDLVRHVSPSHSEHPSSSFCHLHCARAVALFAHAIGICSGGLCCRLLVRLCEMRCVVKYLVLKNARFAPTWPSCLCDELASPVVLP